MAASQWRELKFATFKSAAPDVTQSKNPQLEAPI